MKNAPHDGSARPTIALLALTAVALVAAYATAPWLESGRSVLASGAMMAAGVVAGATILRGARRPGAWPGVRPFGFAALLIAGINGSFLVEELLGSVPGPGPGDLVFLVIGGLILLPLYEELRDHFTEEDRWEVGADVALIATAMGSLAYLLIRPEGAAVGQASVLSSVVFAAASVGAVTAWGALALWVPSLTHLGIFAVMAVIGGAGIPFGYAWVRGIYQPGTPGIEVPLALAPLAMAALLAIEPRLFAGHPRIASGRWGRPILTGGSVGVSCVSLAASVAAYRTGHASSLEVLLLLGVVAAAMVARIVMNQLRSTRAWRAAQRALAEKDAALGEADGALARLWRANETLRASEERLRLLFDAAVDGIVELDQDDVIRHANGAFCRLAGLPASEVVGRAWPELAWSIEGADQSLVSLPRTGQATLARDGHGLHLEARSSDLPGPSPGRLLLIRDVTSARVADQTIRQLFKFLQDRDDDRTRLLRRTNAAIEHERNRIARDLHDGPVQGVSAASLSLEAALLMLKNGSVGAGIDILTKVRLELSEESDNLRRLMGDLRPPVLEERGLVPALQELLMRFRRETEIITNLRSRALVEVAPDVETLAYRIVQEAVTNAAKHSHAESLEVMVEAVAGQLRVEVTDDGRGFDSSLTREFLRDGRVGLASMRERTELANGSFMVRSTLGSGTSVVATVPLDVASARTEAALA
jgi:PAS domain S-box-containing protein